MNNMPFLLLILFFISCSTQPQPLSVSKDVCHFCKMPVAVPNIGAELITEKGKLYKFDDVGCMVHFIRSGLGPGDKIQRTLAVCYTNSQQLIDADKTVFVMSAQFHSPMNSGIAAFESSHDAELFLKDFPGEILSWQQLQQKLN